VLAAPPGWRVWIHGNTRGNDNRQGGRHSKAGNAMGELMAPFGVTVAILLIIGFVATRKVEVEVEDDESRQEDEAW